MAERAFDCLSLDSLNFEMSVVDLLIPLQMFVCIVRSAQSSIRCGEFVMHNFIVRELASRVLKISCCLFNFPQIHQDRAAQAKGQWYVTQMLHGVVKRIQRLLWMPLEA